MTDGREPIDSAELIYRRIPKSVGWYDAETRTLKPEAFDPHKTNDATGLSVSRAKYKSVEQAALGRPGKSYYVAVLSAETLISTGIEITPRPETPSGYDAAHAELPGLNSANRKSTQALELQLTLVDLVMEVVGPFQTPE